MKIITEAVILSSFEPNRFSKNAGIVAAFKCFVMTRVRRPRMTQARSEPMIALPTPIHVDARPYLQPN